GRELDVVTQAETIDSFRPLRESYGSLGVALAMCEAVDHLAQDRQASPALQRMLVGALSTLARAPWAPVGAAFFWRLLCLEGCAPMVDEECVRCGDDTGADRPGSVAFSIGEGGVLCWECAGPEPLRISGEALALVRSVLSGEVRAALAEESPAWGEAGRIGLFALENHLERRLKSARLLMAFPEPSSAPPSSASPSSASPSSLVEESGAVEDAPAHRETRASA
ncbi:MAG: DNA repair protein RecO, partial [Acidimicrobiia bacterium]